MNEEDRYEELLEMKRQEEKYLEAQAFDEWAHMCHELDYLRALTQQQAEQIVGLVESNAKDAELGRVMRPNYEAAKKHDTEFIRWRVSDIDAAISKVEQEKEE